MKKQAFLVASLSSALFLVSCADDGSGTLKIPGTGGTVKVDPKDDVTISAPASAKTKPTIEIPASAFAVEGSATASVNVEVKSVTTATFLADLEEAEVTVDGLDEEGVAVLDSFTMALGAADEEVTISKPIEFKMEKADVAAISADVAGAIPASAIAAEGFAADNLVKMQTTGLDFYGIGILTNGNGDVLSTFQSSTAFDGDQFVFTFDVTGTGIGLSFSMSFFYAPQTAIKKVTLTVGKGKKLPITQLKKTGNKISGLI